MKRLAAIPAVLLLLLISFGLGGLLLSHAIDILGAGELTYARKWHPLVTVSPGQHGFSYYYQVSFFASLGGFLVLLGASMLLYGLAKLLRTVRGPEDRSASFAYSAATYLVFISVFLFVVWFALHCLRYWVVA
jgi:hypothetical protein